MPRRAENQNRRKALIAQKTGQAGLHKTTYGFETIFFAPAASKALRIRQYALQLCPCRNKKSQLQNCKAPKMTEQVRGQGAAAQAYFVYTQPSQRRHSCLLRLFGRVFSRVSRPFTTGFTFISQLTYKAEPSLICRTARRPYLRQSLKAHRQAL